MSVNINTNNNTVNGKIICKKFTLQEHMYLQTMLLHMNVSKNSSTDTEDSNNSDNIRNERIDANDYVNKLWRYADMLYDILILVEYKKAS